MSGGAASPVRSYHRLRKGGKQWYERISERLSARSALQTRMGA